MSSKRTRDGKTSRWDAEESSRGQMHCPEEIRPVRKGPAGLIFMCNSSTKKDCFQYRVLGLPLAKKDLVEQIEPGALFSV
ncbi:hypothetical protein KP509_05G100600 [Ceratopteris richardii]|uniref:DCD domain-containing protein n=1 Tax=Ceratopteris richardii TaxID=49495 RepID=A0A8T2UX14_CERRI|nr:hypothetical protein KP509_05G100600 [Ceratopteris richardii]